MNFIKFALFMLFFGLVQDTQASQALRIPQAASETKLEVEFFRGFSDWSDRVALRWKTLLESCKLTLDTLAWDYEINKFRTFGDFIREKNNPLKPFYLAIHHAPPRGNPTAAPRLHFFEGTQFTTYIPGYHEREVVDHEGHSLRSSDNVCYLKFNQQKNCFEYVCSLRDLITKQGSGAPGRDHLPAGRFAALRKEFREAGIGDFDVPPLSNLRFIDEKTESGRVCCVDPTVSPLPANELAKHLIIGALVGLGKGLLNNWLAQKNGVIESNKHFYCAPIREWHTGLISFVAWFSTLLSLHSRSLGYRKDGVMAAQTAVIGLGQLVGEIVPLSKTAGWRNVACNFQLPLAALSLFGSLRRR